MKFRLGFVSNSSSSSFVIAVRGDLRGNLSRNLEKNPLSSVFAQLIDVIVSESRLLGKEEIKDSYEDFFLKNGITNEFKSYTCSFSSENEGIEYALSQLDIFVKTNDLIFLSDN